MFETDERQRTLRFSERAFRQIPRRCIGFKRRWWRQAFSHSDHRPAEAATKQYPHKLHAEKKERHLKRHGDTGLCRQPHPDGISVEHQR